VGVAPAPSAARDRVLVGDVEGERRSSHAMARMESRRFLSAMMAYRSSSVIWASSVYFFLAGERNLQCPRPPYPQGCRVLRLVSEFALSNKGIQHNAKS
jgi:hypothetical protein